MKRLIFALFIFSLMACSKNENDSQKLKLANGLMTDSDTTGFTGIAACYWTLNQTLENPPDDYIPGSAQLEFQSCIGSYGGGSSSGPTLYPPAPPVILTKVYPDAPNVNDDQVLKAFFHLYIDYVNGTQPDYAGAGAKINLYNSLIMQALSTYPPAGSNNLDKINSCVTYIFNYPPSDPTFNQSEFLDYVTNVVYKYAGPLRITIAFSRQLSLSFDAYSLFTMLL
jgi:hypothetical protein